MSPRAAWRLEQLGFEAYDYVAGKADWLAAGLPTEGRGPRPLRALDVADREVPTCKPGERLGAIARRAQEGGWDVCVVVNDDRVVLGVLSGKLLRVGDEDLDVADVMREGPPTVRADVEVPDLVDRLARAAAHHILVTTPDGELLGVVRLDEARAALAVVDDGAQSNTATNSPAA